MRSIRRFEVRLSLLNRVGNFWEQSRSSVLHPLDFFLSIQSILEKNLSNIQNVEREKMSKRKRSHSQTASERFHSNPFLCHIDTQEKQESEQGNKSNKRFHAFLSFVELSKEKTGEDVNLKITKVVNELLFTLSAPAEEEQNGGFMISSLDIVGLLLPWAIQNILRSQNDPFECKTHWHTLERCLQYLALSSQNSSDVSSKAFALSTLNKLVPMAGNIAFLELPTLGEIAGSCYCLLVDHFYKAPFDVVCDTLLKMVGDGQVGQIKESDRILQ